MWLVNKISLTKPIISAKSNKVWVTHMSMYVVVRPHICARGCIWSCMHACGCLHGFGCMCACMCGYMPACTYMRAYSHVCGHSSMCIRGHRPTQVYTCLPIHENDFEHTYIHSDECRHAPTGAYACPNLHANANTYIHTSMCILTSMHTSVHSNLQLYIFTYTFTFVCTQTHILSHVWEPSCCVSSAICLNEGHLTINRDYPFLCICEVSVKESYCQQQLSVLVFLCGSLAKQLSIACVYIKGQACVPSYTHMCVCAHAHV